ncbi:MAG: hypothetical protein AAFW69_02315, partial [Pseudomonadota bacterium]
MAERMSEAEIEALVDAEIARRRVAGALEGEDGRAARIARHPLFLALVAFLLTTVIGGAYDQLTQARKADEAARDARIAAIEAQVAEGIAELSAFTRLVQARPQLRLRAPRDGRAEEIAPQAPRL